MNPVPLNRNSCTYTVIQFLAGTMYYFHPQKSRPAVCHIERQGQLVLVPLSPALKRLEHDDDNSSLSSAKIGSSICLPPYAVLAFTHNIVILLFYILGSRCRFERRGGGFKHVMICGPHSCYCVRQPQMLRRS